MKRQEKIRAYSFTEGTSKKNIRKDIENEPEDFLKETLSNRFGFGVDNIMSYGYYKEMGYLYPLQSYLTHYVWKKWGNWQENYALSKGNLRFLVGGKIDKIIEL